MWTEIADERSLLEFQEFVHFFHDSCIKEIRYISGAYVASDLSMHPVNDARVLRVIIQRQSQDHPMIELEFEGLKYLKLFPTDGSYTCEILGSSMFLDGQYVYWADCDGVSASDFEENARTMVCAEKLRWRPIHNCYMGNDLFYRESEDIPNR